MSLTVDGSSTLNGTVTINANTTSLILNENDETDENTQLLSAGGTFRIRTRSDDGSTNTERFRVSHNTGDISFYDDTGSTAQRVILGCESTERLGIGNNFAYPAIKCACPRQLWNTNRICRRTQRVSFLWR